MLNDVKLQGRLTRDPELRRTNNGKAVCSFSIANEPDYVPQGQEKKASFFDVVCWEGTAEYASKHLSKGRMVLACGRLSVRKYTDKNGNERVSTELVADHIYHMDSKPAGNAQPSWTKQADNAEEDPDFKQIQMDEEYNGELPF